MRFMARFSAELLVLRVLLDGAAFGGQIVDRIENLTEGEITLGAGTLRPALARMSSDGLVEVVDAPDGTRGKTKRVYTITKKGRVKALNDKRLVRRIWEL